MPVQSIARSYLHEITSLTNMRMMTSRPLRQFGLRIHIVDSNGDDVTLICLVSMRCVHVIELIL